MPNTRHHGLDEDVPDFCSLACLEGLVDADGDLTVDEQNVRVHREGEGRWRIGLVDENYQPLSAD